MRRLTLLTVMMMGCTGAPPPSPPPTASQLVLGDVTGAPLTDGQDVTLVAGAQGGFHVWLTWRATDMGADELVLERTAHRVSDGQLVLRSSTSLWPDAPGADGWVAAPMPLPMFMCPSPVGLSVIDVPIRFELSFSAVSGTPLVNQSVTLVPHCPVEARDFCQRICNG